MQGATEEVLLQLSMCATGTDAANLWARGSSCKLVVPAADVGDVSHAVLRLAGTCSQHLAAHNQVQV